MYDNIVTLWSYKTMTHIGPKFIVIIFNVHTKTIIHVFFYKSHSTSHPTIVLGDFNVDMIIT